MKSGTVNQQKHPYLRTDFWLNPENHFWNSRLYTEKAKRYYESSLRKFLKSHRNPATI
jgi:hypothetical protein